MKVFLAVAALAGLVTAQSRLEFSKYHLSQCTEGYIAHAAREMTGTEAIEEGKYGYCLVYTQDDIFFDWKCLCRAGDGEGSAIIDTARQAGLVGLDCGWDYTFAVVFPEMRNFCRTLLREDIAISTPRRHRALKQPPSMS
ncbi:hypothetical protein QR685DRAFT_440750 [Neurospora intermedia]|uniref:Uncharacterized protein n=1 Tax=Neurospora intermedia TaxID=5142 RepID=A0ABR3DEV1_NEUIN